MNAKRFSINWGKGLPVVLVVLGLIVVALIAFNAVPMTGADTVAVDWGSSVTPCAPTNLKCRFGAVAVDWGSLTTPCLPSNPKCQAPVAVDWGSRAQPPCSLSNPNCKGTVAVDWGSSAPKF